MSRGKRGERDVSAHQRGIEGGRHAREESLAQYSLEHEELKLGGHVRVHSIFAEELFGGCEGQTQLFTFSGSSSQENETHLMVLNVILLEHHREGHSNRHIGDNRKQPIRLYSPEGEVVGDLVHSEEGILVCRPADGPGEEEEGEGEEGGVAEGVGREKLDAGDE